MAVKNSKRELSEAQLNSPDIDQDGEFDVEHYQLPSGDNIKDNYLRTVWNDAVEGLKTGDGVEDTSELGANQ